MINASLVDNFGGYLLLLELASQSAKKKIRAILLHALVGANN